MSFDPTVSLQALMSVIAASGYCTGGVRARHPLAPPDGDYAAHVFYDEITVNQLFAGGEDEQTHTLGIRVYQVADRSPNEEHAEIELGQLVGNVIGAIAADADLAAGANGVRNVDAAGITGESVRAFWGYEEIGGTQYRTVDIVVPLIVDGSATWQA